MPLNYTLNNGNCSVMCISPKLESTEVWKCMVNLRHNVARAKDNAREVTGNLEIS